MDVTLSESLRQVAEFEATQLRARVNGVE